MSFLALQLAALTIPLMAQEPPAAAIPAPAPNAAAAAMLQSRARDLIALINGGGNYAATFTPQFVAQVPEAQFRALSAQIVAGAGKAVKVQSLTAKSANAGELVIAAERGTMSFRIAVEASAPHRIAGLLSTGIGTAETSIPAVADTFRALPGTTSFAIAELGAKPKLTTAHNPDQPLAIGSAFKLVILAELVRQVNAGSRKWDDMITLDGSALPGGAYTQKPKGTQASLRELAEKMISVSDNSATDLLLFALGRERVEAMQQSVGIREPVRNRPFLSALEAFQLKGSPALMDRWVAADERGRRALLPQIKAVPLMALAGLFVDGKPVRPDKIEWFMSASDLIRTMDWLRRNTEAGPGAEARRILGINPGIGPDASGRYAYVGYKGGSEPGVMNMTVLTRAKSGKWQVVVATWNNPAAPVEEARMAALVSRAAELAAN